MRGDDTAADGGEQDGNRLEWSRRQFLRAGAAAGLGGLGAGAAPPVTAAPPDVPRENFHVYLAWGQSNMEGQGEVAPRDRETNPRVHVLQDKTCSGEGWQYGEWRLAEPPLNRCWAGIGPADYFGKKMAAETPEEVHIGLVPAAISGAKIELFQKGAPIGNSDKSVPHGFTGAYDWLLDLAQTAQESGTIKGMIFHQGESNTGQQDWKYKVQGIVENLTSDLGIGDVPFVAGEMLYGGCCDVHNEEVHELPNVIPNAHVVSAEGLAGQDPYHFTAEGYRTLGRRYAREMLAHVDVGSVETPTPEAPPPVAGDARPTDPDDDGHYEDVDGDGDVNFNDLVAHYQHQDDPAMTDHLGAYDYTDDGELDFNDLVALYQEMRGR